jgi:hypothetical protein
MGNLEASKVHFPALLKLARMPLWQEQRKFWKQIVTSVAASKPEKEPGQQGMSGNKNARQFAGRVAGRARGT